MLPYRSPTAPARLGDHSADPRMVMLCAMALAVGTGSAAGAWVLLRLIALCTNLFWFGNRKDYQLYLEISITKEDVRYSRLIQEFAEVLP